jgi:hypothetical protein
MKVTLRADDVNQSHTRFTVFVNGGNCGQLCMVNTEAIAFYMIVNNGCHPRIDEFLGKGHWEGGIENFVNGKASKAETKEHIEKARLTRIGKKDHWKQSS